MNPNLPADLYPHATSDGRSIPLEVVRPQGLAIKAITEVSSSLTLPTEVEAVLFYATRDCLVRFGADFTYPADGVYEADTLFIPKGHSFSVLLPDETIYARLLVAGSANLFVQAITKWAGLSIDNNYVRR